MIPVLNNSVLTDTVICGGELLTPNYYSFSHETGAQIIAGIAGKRIRVLAAIITAAAAALVRFQTNNDSGDFLFQVYLPANGQIVAPLTPTGWFQAATGEHLYVDVSEAVTINLVYVEVPV